MVTSIESNLALQHFGEGEWRPPIVKTEATTGRGIAELWQTIKAFRAHSEGTARQAAEGAQRVPAARPADAPLHGARRATVLAPGEFEALIERIAEREVDPYTAASDILSKALKRAGIAGEAMKAVLDHVGIAVSDLQASLAFLSGRARPRTSSPARSASQRVRAPFLWHRAVDARAARGDGARFADREVPREARPRPASCGAARRRHRRRARAPEGARHPADRRQGRGPGAEGALVAFIHPSAAHGVLVELKQPAPKVEMFRTVDRATRSATSS